jgi:hemoglobin/transferrin/lactoferrin receptor protein
MLSNLLFLIVLFAYGEGEEKSQPFVIPRIEVKSNITKSDQGFITNSPSYLRKNNQEASIANGDSLSDYLYDEPNLDVIGGPRASAQLPQIRGLGSERTLILDEGVRQNFQSGHNGRVFSDFNLVREVEVIKGPWSSLYGSGALGGVINFRRVQASDYEKKDLGSEVNTTYSSTDESFTQTLILFSNTGKLKPLVSIRNVESENVRLGDGQELAFSASKLQEYTTSLEYEINKRHSLTLKSVIHDNQTETPLNPTIDLEDLNRVGDNKFRKEDAVLTYEYKSKRLSVTAKPYFRSSTVETRRLSDSRADERKVQTFGLDAWVNFANTLTENLSTSSIIGVEYFNDDNSGTRDSVSLSSFPNGQSEYMSVYAQESIYIGEKLELSTGLRFDSFSNSDANGTFSDNDGEELTARVQANYKFNERTSLFAGFGQAFNAPRLQDVYITGLHFAGQPPFLSDNFFIPNPDLIPEESDSFEMGYSYESEDNKINISATVFHNEVDNFIVRNVDVSAGTTNFINENFVKLSGFELTSRFNLSSKFSLSFNYGQTRSRVVEGETTLQDTLPDKYALTLIYKPTSKWSFQSITLLYETQDRVPAGFEETDGYFLQNFFASYQATKKLNFRLSVVNAFDRSFVQHGNVIQNPGRDMQLFARYIF